MTTTVVGMYDDMFHAQSAVADLVREGIPQTDISVVANHDLPDTVARTVVVEDPSAAATGAGTGAVMGGAAGLALGLAAVAVPGVGPVFAAGPIFAALSGMVLGAATGGIIGALVDLGVPDAEATYYAEGIRRGSVVLTCRVPTNFAVRAKELLALNGAVDIQERVAFWREQGWSVFNPSLPAYTRDEIDRERKAWSTRPKPMTVEERRAA